MNKIKGLKNITLGLVLIASMFVMVNLIEEVAAVTRTVDNTGGTPYQTIRQALMVSGPNDVIVVNYGTGTYNENNPLTISVPLTIVGQVQNNLMPTVVAINTGSNVFSITAGFPTRLENLGITGATGMGCSGVYSQVTATNGNEVVIQNCRVYSNYIGVTFTSGSSFNIIDDSYVYSNIDNGINFEGTNNQIDDCGSSFSANTGVYDNGGNGVYSTCLTNSRIEDSNIYDNDSNGIFMSTAKSNTIQNVEIWLNDEKGLYLSGDSNDVDGMGNRHIKDNIFTGISTFDVYISGYSNTLEGYTITQTNGAVGRTGVQTIHSEPSGLHIYPNIIYNCEISNYDGAGSIGVWVDGGDDVTGSSTEIYDNMIGIKLGDTSASSIVDCDNTAHASGSENIFDNELGIQVNCDDAIILETYFYYSPGVGGDDVGILIDNSVIEAFDADIDDCKFEKLDIGIEIIDSSSNQHSSIDGSEFDDMTSYGIYMSNGWCDQVTDCTFDDCIEAGIYLDDANGYLDEDDTIHYLEISESTFSNTVYSTTSLHTGIYGTGVIYIEIDDCTFDGYRKGVWLNDESVDNIISSCTFSDANDRWTSGTWGQNTADVGIHCKYMSGSNLIDTCVFSDLRYAIGIEGCYYIDIFGNTASYSTMTDCYVDLFAKYLAINGQGNVGSTGRIRDYGTSITVELEGTSSDDTDFTYKDLEGTTSYTSGAYDSFTLET